MVSEDQFAALRAMAAKLVRDVEATHRFVQSLPTPELYIRQHKATEKLLHKLAAQGWTIPMHLSLADTHEVAETRLPSDYDAEFVQYFTASNGEYFELVAGEIIASETVASWKPLLEECVTAYRQGLFRIVIPSLLPVIERTVIDLGGGGKVVTAAKARAEALSYRFFAKIVWSSIAVFAEKVFDTGRSGPGAVLNRNLILHGRSLPAEWTQADALRLFNAIHTLTVLPELRTTEHTVS
jgi:hypothetical protein